MTDDFFVEGLGMCRGEPQPAVISWHDDSDEASIEEHALKGARPLTSRSSSSSSRSPDGVGGRGDSAGMFVFSQDCARSRKEVTLSTSAIPGDAPASVIRYCVPKYTSGGACG